MKTQLLKTSKTENIYLLILDYGEKSSNSKQLKHSLGDIHYIHTHYRKRKGKEKKCEYFKAWMWECFKAWIWEYFKALKLHCMVWINTFLKKHMLIYECEGGIKGNHTLLILLKKKMFS